MDGLQYCISQRMNSSSQVLHSSFVTAGYTTYYNRRSNFSFSIVILANSFSIGWSNRSVTLHTTHLQLQLHLRAFAEADVSAVFAAAPRSAASRRNSTMRAARASG
uniref:Uncharacterized protein n=1 Tax=Chaetoceros debilis TaxID=122233 RepID=A0A7S3QAV6_9STRA